MLYRGLSRCAPQPASRSQRSSIGVIPSEWRLYEERSTPVFPERAANSSAHSHIRSGMKLCPALCKASQTSEVSRSKAGLVVIGSSASVQHSMPPGRQRDAHVFASAGSVAVKTYRLNKVKSLRSHI